jgi:hypothetical protein
MYVFGINICWILPFLMLGINYKPTTMKRSKCNDAANLNKVTRRKYSVYSMVLLSTFSVGLFSCSGGPYEEKYASENTAALADSVASIASSNAAVLGKADSTHTFIRTADIKFKVKDVKLSTFAIEDLVNRHGGYVTYTHLSSNISSQYKTQVSADSTEERTHFNVNNSITIRVPNTQLDSVMRGMAPLMDFLDHRIIKADDIKYTLLANQLAENRYKKHKQRFTKTIDTKGKKLKESVNAEDELLIKDELADNTKIETMELMDQVNYSTVTLYIYQPETIKKMLVANEEKIEPYVPSFGKRLGTAFTDGWHVFENIILFFVNIWGVIILMIGLVFLLKWMITYFSRQDLRKV